MTGRRRSIVGRDQRVSAFGPALMRLCDAVGALGAALVDGEGETVDYAGSLDPFDIKVAAAEWAILISLLRASRVAAWSCTDQIIVRGTRKTFLVQTLEDGYALVLQLLPHAFGVSRRGLAEAARELSAEAGLALPASFRRERERWFRVDVRCEPQDPRRPAAVWVLGAWFPVEILGRWSSDPPRRELGYRARLATGAEFTLVREPLGRWYADTPVA